MIWSREKAFGVLRFFRVLLGLLQKIWFLLFSNCEIGVLKTIHHRGPGREYEWKITVEIFEGTEKNRIDFTESLINKTYLKT